jgi:hypothetical protein
MMPPICPVHKIDAVLVSDVEVYGKSFGRSVWKCPELKCDMRASSDPVTGAPIATMAGFHVRRARIAAHKSFDRWWRSIGISRREAYQTLADRLGVSEAHMGQMSESECKAVQAMFTVAAKNKRPVKLKW